MRVATNEMQRQAVNSLLNQQFQLNKLQQQLSTGERFSTPAEDPIGAVSVLDLDESLKITRQYDSNANVAKTRLSVTELTINEMEAKLQRVRELSVQANNDTFNNQDRAIIAQEVRLLVDGLVELSNSKDADGEYLFAGFQGRTTPFTLDATGRYVYNGDEGQRLLQIGPTRQVALNDSGLDVFTAIKRIQATATPTNAGSGAITAGYISQPNDYQPHNFTIAFTSTTTFDVTNNTTGQVVLSNQTYADGEPISFNGTEVTIEGAVSSGDSFVVAPTANDNVFNAVLDLVDTLENAPSAIDELEGFHDDMKKALNDIDQSMEAMLQTRTQIGGRLNTIASQNDVNSAYSFQMEKAISELKDLDFVTAISQFNVQLTALQAAQQSYIRIQNLNLFSVL